MKKRSKVRKNNFRINRNFYIFQGIIISLLLYLTWGSWVKFIFFVALEMTAYFTFIYYFLAKQANQKRKKKSIYSKEGYKKVKSNTPGIAEFREPKSSRRIGRKNFNWDISKRSQEQKSMTSSNYTPNALNKNPEKLNPLNSGFGSINSTNKSVAGEEIKKFVPYRSPFDPIRPKEEEQKVEIEEASELFEADVLDAEELKVDLKEFSIEENVEENIPHPQVECNIQMDTLKSVPENNDNLYEVSERDKKVPNDPKPAHRYAAHNCSPYIPVQSSKRLLDMAEYEPPIELLKKSEVLSYDE
jgi:S-DNA-T family DNA segregation ATPase FtsK/SpoIIIE